MFSMSLLHKCPKEYCLFHIWFSCDFRHFTIFLELYIIKMASTVWNGIANSIVGTYKFIPFDNVWQPIHGTIGKRREIC